MQENWSTSRFGLMVVLASFGLACESTENGRPRPDQIPLLVSLNETTVQSGFAMGTLRRYRALQAYRITKYPITRAQFGACVQAGVCQALDPSSCGETAYAPYGMDLKQNYREGPADGPAVCVVPSEAKAYCEWIGGRLPMLDEWLFAARGDTPRRYSWGDEVTNCEQHALAPQVLARLHAREIGQEPLGTGSAKCPTAELGHALLNVGHHGSGASPRAPNMLIRS